MHEEFVGFRRGTSQRPTHTATPVQRHAARRPYADEVMTQFVVVVRMSFDVSKCRTFPSSSEDA